MLKLKIAGFLLNFYLENFTILKKLNVRYKYFLRDDNNSAIDIFLTSRNITSDLINNFRISESNNSLLISRNDIDVIYDGNKFEGSIEDHEYSFDMLLRGIMNILCVKNNMVMVHSTGILLDKKAYIFAGEEARGKSTLSKEVIKNNIEILSDEIVFIKSNNNEILAYPSPFMGEIYSKRSNNSHPIKEINILDGWNENLYYSSSKKIIIPLFMKTIINYLESSYLSCNFFNTVIDILNVKTINLVKFKKNNFWEWFYARQKNI